MRRVRRIVAHGLCRDEAGRVLLVRAAARSNDGGRWSLPGGGVRHGEHPAEAAVREIAEETGLRVRVDRLRDVVTDIERLPDALRHHDRVIFDCWVVGGTIHPPGSAPRAAWWSTDQLLAVPLTAQVARLLGVPVVADRPAGERDEAPDDPAALLAAGPADGPVPARHQRFAAYGLVTDPESRVLLTRIAEGYPGAGRWHLPGGGTDFGESAVDGFLREVVEETGQQARITGLLTVSHRHHCDAVGPEGVPIDWHGVRVVYRATVDRPSPARVVEARGSTESARWLGQRLALTLPLTEVAREAIESDHD